MVLSSSAPKAVSSTSGPSSSSIGGRPRLRVDTGDERILGLLGFVDVEALGVVGEEELDEALGVVALVGAREDTCSRDAHERARIAAVEEVVRDRRVRLLFLHEVEVVVVDEPEVDLACRDGLDDRRVLLVLLRVVRLQLRRATACVASSPSESRMAVTNAWKDAFVGAMPIRPFHFGSVRSKTESGTSSSDSSSVLYAMTRERPDVPTQRPSASRKRARRRDRALRGQLRELRVDRSERAGVLREEHVGRRVVAFLGDRRGELGAVAVAHLDFDAGLVVELLEERLDELLLAARVDRERVVRAAVAPAAAGEREAPSAEC